MVEESEEFVEVYAGDFARAELVREMLDNFGLSPELRDAFLGAIAPFYVAAGGAGAVKVVVPAAEAERARALVCGLEAADVGPDWTCPGCGERIEGRFDACWQCGARRPPETQSVEEKRP